MRLVALFFLGFALCQDVAAPQMKKVKDTKFEPGRGFYTAAIDVLVSSNTEGASIRYTTDGSDPEASPTMIEQPSPVYVRIDPALTQSPAVVLRAYAVKEGMLSTNVDAHTFVFPSLVVQQQAPPSFAGEYSYTMDPEVAAQHVEMETYLMQLPVFALSGAAADVFGPTGLLKQNSPTNPVNEEMKMSIEMFYNDKKGFSSMGGVSVHSTSNSGSGKRSLRLRFRSKYGVTRLRERVFERAVWHNATAVKSFDTLVLKAGSADSLFGSYCSKEGKGTYLADQLARDTQIAMSGVGVHGQYVHLFLNGLYWGLYNLMERPDAAFFASYFGGDKKDWYVGNSGGTVDGVDTQMTKLFNRRKHFKAVATDFLDVEQFSSYLLYHMYAGIGDWPGKNWYAGNYNRPANSHPADLAAAQAPSDQKVRFIVWDAEESFVQQGPEQCAAEGGGMWRASRTAWLTPALLGVSNVFLHDTSLISELFRAMMPNAEFRVRFASAMYNHCYNNGALADKNMLTRLEKLRSAIEKAVVLESARWGQFKAGSSSSSSSSSRWGVQDWEEAVAAMKAAIKGNCQRLKAALQAQKKPAPHPNLFPYLAAPVFRRRDQVLIATKKLVVPSGFLLNIIRPTKRGMLWFTTNGKDPRVPFNNGPAGKRASNGKSAQVVIRQNTVVIARTKKGKVWSPLHRLELFVRTDFEALSVTEIMFNPPGKEEGTEFIELANLGERRINIGQCRFTQGLELTVEPGTVLEPQQRVLLVRNITAFQDAYGYEVTLQIIGEFAGSKLSNKGEVLQLETPVGAVIFSFSFKDHWYAAADGDGASLVRNACAQDLSQPAAWRPSVKFGGSPGKPDAAEECDYVVPASAPASSYSSQQSLLAGQAAPVAWNSCHGKCACADLQDPYCCVQEKFDAQCEFKASSDAVCVQKCGAV